MIKFKTPETAQKCLTLMQGRWFGGRQLVVHLWVALPLCTLPLRLHADAARYRQGKGKGQGQHRRLAPVGRCWL
jgi:hypothetical protein